MRYFPLILAAALAVLGFILLRPASSPQATPSAPQSQTPALLVHCAAGLKKPLEQVAALFRSETGTEIHLQFGGTASLLSGIRTTQRGDLFISADSAGIEDGKKFDLIQEVVPFATQSPVIAVQKSNPHRVTSLKDLLNPQLRVALVNPETAAVGRLIRTLLGEAYTPLAQKAVVTKPTVPDVANDLSLGTIDAAILWDSTVSLFSNLESIAVPELSAHSEPASVAVLTSCTQPQVALRFARFLAAPEKGGTVLRQNGFRPIDGDPWAQTPELLLYSGAVNRLAIESLLRQFSDREGVKVTTVFNGCGVLCASMKSMVDNPNAKLPDAYYACDLCFVPPVAAQFPQVSVLTETEIGMVVRKGNPHRIQSVADLATQGLKIGLCNAEQSTLGFMTRGILSSLKIEADIRKNVAVEVPTADFLINQMRAGALDAAIVYKVNALPQTEHLDFLPIPHPGAKAVQPFSIRSGSSQRQLAQRLLEFFQRNRSQFESAGFSWRGDEIPVESSRIEVPEWLRPNKDAKP
jgi:molybdate transport system substrate-binding protein